jgi:hypothetical protein
MTYLLRIRWSAVAVPSAPASGPPAVVSGFRLAAAGLSALALAAGALAVPAQASTSAASAAHGWRIIKMIGTKNSGATVLEYTP